MQFIWQNLIWKEWHEQKWKLAALSTILLAAEVSTGWSDRRIFDERAIPWLHTFYTVFASLFIALGMASERREASFQFLRSLPIPLWRYASTRLVGGALTVTVPFVVAIPFAVCGLASSDTGLLVAGAFSALSIFMWIAAVSCTQSTEPRAALAGIAVLSVWGLLPAMMKINDYRGNPLWNWNDLWWLLVLISPVGQVTFDYGEPFRNAQVSLVWFQAATILAMAIWIVSAFGRLATRNHRAPRGASHDATLSRSRLAKPYINRLAAIAWTQWRETLPLLLAGPIVVTCLTASAFSALTSSRISPELRLGWIIGTASEITVPIGIGLAVLLGVVTFAPDLQPDIFSFWRSRPINPSLWFWMKYLVGDSAVLLTLYAPVVLLECYFEWWGRNQYFAPGFFACMPLVHLLAYSGAVCMICLVRHSAYAGILAIALPIAFVVLCDNSFYPLNQPIWMNPWLVKHSVDQVYLGWAYDPASILRTPLQVIFQYSAFVLFMASLIVPLTVLGWLGVRNDLGRMLRITNER